jgi:hypothetical protein
MKFTPAMPAMPPEIASRVLLVMRAVGKIAKESKNAQGNYQYASVDAFLEIVNPACAEAGLIIAPIELSCEPSEFETVDRDGRTKIRRQSTYRYNFMLIAEDGTTWCNERDVRSVTVEATGAQAAGAAQSYALKQFDRALFQIPTGDEDADAADKIQASTIRATVAAARTKRETGEKQVVMHFGGTAEPVPASDVHRRVMDHLATFDLESDAYKWWQDQVDGRAQLHAADPKLSMSLKRAVEGHFSQEAAE